jgi:putative transposase
MTDWVQSLPVELGRAPVVESVAAAHAGNAALLVDGSDETVARVAELALLPNRVQSRRLDRLLDLVREGYNAGLQERRDAWRLKAHSVSLFDQFGQITELRRLRPEIVTFGNQPLRGALRRVDHAFAGFFRRCAAGEKAGYPRSRVLAATAASTTTSRSDGS